MAQVLALLALRPGNRALLAIGWKLWLEGWNVDLRLVRGYLINVARLHDRVLHTAHLLGLDRPWLTRRALRLIERWARSRSIPTRLRRRLSSDSELAQQRFATVMRVMVQVLTGSYTPDATGIVAETDNDGWVVERALGLEAARKHVALGVGPWLDGDPRETLVALQRVLGGTWIQTINEATEEQLVESRNALRDLRELLVGVGDAFRTNLGSDMAGFPQIADTLRQPSGLESAGLALVLLRAEADPRLAAGVADLRALLPEWRTTYAPVFGAIGRLRSELPALGPLLAPERMREVLRSKVAFDAHLARLAMVGREYRAAIRDILARESLTQQEPANPPREFGS